MFVNGYEVVVFHSGKEIEMVKTTDYSIAQDIYKRLNDVVKSIEEYEEKSDYTILYSRVEMRPTTLYVPVDEEES